MMSKPKKQKSKAQRHARREDIIIDAIYTIVVTLISIIGCEFMVVI